MYFTNTLWQFFQISFLFCYKYTLSFTAQTTNLFSNGRSREIHTCCKTYYTQIEIIQRHMHLLFSDLLCADYTSNTKRNKLIYGGSYELLRPGAGLLIFFSLQQPCAYHIHTDPLSVLQCIRNNTLPRQHFFKNWGWMQKSIYTTKVNSCCRAFHIS